jgi:hypothetical protein
LRRRVMQAAFKVRLYKKSASFTWLSTCDLKVKVNVEELARLARKLGLEVNGASIAVDSLDSYNRLLVYAAVRPFLKDHAQLAWLVQNMNSWEASYWASAVREAWWAGEGQRGVSRVARAFITLFGLM